MIEIMDERSDITNKGRDMNKECGYNSSNNNQKLVVKA
ncbi:hypothetical protein HISP_18570 (plasmid) [Haloarcula hispanica N601]|uniref:Uncharacterized protein n=1 Tax=Haloarcula hispanica N601 TaxID=1417673 RepID=V5TSW5_HALHI|nr:hypothetical protein HISP_18570 [Haloarcula hispanica N601]